LEVIENGPLLSIDENDEVQINKSFVKEESNKFNFSEDEIRDITRDVLSGLYYSNFNQI
jgi:hypothetical protein